MLLRPSQSKRQPDVEHLRVMGGIVQELRERLLGRRPGHFPQRCLRWNRSFLRFFVVDVNYNLVGYVRNHRCRRDKVEYLEVFKLGLVLVPKCLEF